MAPSGKRHDGMKLGCQNGENAYLGLEGRGGLIGGDRCVAAKAQVVDRPPGGEGQGPPQPHHTSLQKGLLKTTKNGQDP
jgi:hypothetical protein